jgi:hypothetical protein
VTSSQHGAIPLSPLIDAGTNHSIASNAIINPDATMETNADRLVSVCAPEITEHVKTNMGIVANTTGNHRLLPSSGLNGPPAPDITIPISAIGRIDVATGMIIKSSTSAT